MASARNSRTTRRTDPPMAFIRPTSFFRSMATLLMPAITHSEVRKQHQKHRRGKQSADAVVNPAFGFGELLDAVNVGARKALANVGDESASRNQVSRSR